MEHFRQYLTYTEYKELGGTSPEDKFLVTLRKAQRWLDHFTFNRIKHLVKIPEAVKEVLTEYIDRLQTLDSQKQSGAMISRYSNGVEAITYELKTEAQLKRELYSVAKTWLPDFLLCRQVNFDVDEYLQTENHDFE